MPTTATITLSDDNLLGEYVSLDAFKGVLEQRFAIGPDTLAVLIRDGEIAEASAGGHFAVGGLFRTLKDALAGRHALRLLIADLKPFQLTTTAHALTKDNVPVDGEFTIELQVNPEKPANVLGLMREHTAVTKTSVLGRLEPHLGDRVLNSAIRRVDAVELRGNVGMQDKIQADVMQEVERLASDLGLIVRAVSMRWAYNEEEKALVLKRQQEREQEILEREFKILNRSVERESESTIMRLKTDLSVEKVKQSTEDELRRMILTDELAFIDARETGLRIQQIKTLEHELQLNRTQRLDGLKAQLEAEQHAIEMARTGGQRRDVELDIARREREHNLAALRIQSEIRAVERSIEELDRKQALALRRLEEMQQLDIAARAHEDQLRTMKGLQDVELDLETRRLDLNIKGGDAEHRRRMESARLADDTTLSKMQLLKDSTPEQILAINAGFSQDVANVLVEQARARAADGVDRMALMREMIQQAQDARVASEAQARHLFEVGMQGAVGVAQGVGNAVAGKPAAPVTPTPANDTTECPACHRVIPAADRHCRYCGRQMRQ